MSPLAIFVTDISASNGEIIGLEPIRDGEYCGVRVSYEGNVKLVGFTLWMGQSEVVIGDLEKGSVRERPVDCDVMSEPIRISFTVAGLYPFEIRLNTTGGQP